MTAAPAPSHPASLRAIYLGAKRLTDVVGATLILTATAPLLLAAAVAVKCTSPGPVFYRARRAGRDGVPFAMFKFRTMRVAAPAERERKITDAADDRITRTGALLRRTKIDELPQLLNVLKGDMSLVGPRPEDFDLVERHYTPELRRALWTRPGITCTAEIRWYPDLTYHDPPPAGASMQDHYIARHLPAQAAEGVRYVERQSMLFDLQILARTVVNVLVRSWWPPPRKPLSLPADGNARR
jgi:lipopolysaccharide/colanic/teichoic acid biosynthesis glycosyltransferase